jgi:hypothetical protein
LFTEIRRKFEFSAQGVDLAPLSFCWQWDQSKNTFRVFIKTPLLQTSLISLMSLKQIPTANIRAQPHTHAHDPLFKNELQLSNKLFHKIQNTKDWSFK